MQARELTESGALRTHTHVHFHPSDKCVPKAAHTAMGTGTATWARGGELTQNVSEDLWAGVGEDQGGA